MSSISLSGLSTGMDTQSIVQQLVQAESSRLLAYQNKLKGFQEKQSVIDELKNRLSALKTSLNKLSDSSQLRSFSATSSDEDFVTVSASSSAFEGSHSVQIKQLATADRWVHSGYKYATSDVGAGNFIVSYNNQQLVVQTTDETTLQDLVNSINNDAENPGITASLLEYDDGSGNNFHLVLSGESSGSDYQISVDSSSAEVRTAQSTLTANGNNAALSDKLSDLDDFSGQTPAFNFSNLTQVTISGDRNDGTDVNSVFTVNAYSTVEDLIGGIESAFGNTVKVTFEEGQLKVTDKITGGSEMTLSLNFQNTTQSATLATTQTVAGGSITASLPALAAGNFIETQSAQDAMIKVDGYPQDVIELVDGQPVVTQENWISRSSNTIDDVITGVTLNLQGSTANSSGGYDSIDVNLTRNTEQLKSKIGEMVKAYNAVMAYFEENTAYNEETNTSGLLSSEYSLTSIRGLLKSMITGNATGFTAVDSFDNLSDVGLTLDADGQLELDNKKFDEAVVDDYLGVLSLLGAAKTGTTSGADAAYVKFYGSSKSTTAGTFNVRVNTDGTVLIKLSSESWSQARQATISGTGTIKYIYGDSSLNDSGKPAHPEFDLQLSIDTSQIGRQMDVTVNIRQGAANNMFDQMTSALKTGTGTVSIAVDSIEDRIDNMEDRIDTEQTRLDNYKARLTAKYARLEKLLSTIQQQFSGLSAL